MRVWGFRDLGFTVYVLWGLRVWGFRDLGFRVFPNRALMVLNSG